LPKDEEKCEYCWTRVNTKSKVAEALGVPVRAAKERLAERREIRRETHKAIVRTIPEEVRRKVLARAQIEKERELAKIEVEKALALRARSQPRIQRVSSAITQAKRVYAPPKMAGSMRIGKIAPKATPTRKP
jgi:hypothetical protein